MKTCKKLLAIALVAAVLLTTLVSGLVVSAADANTLVIGTTEIVKGTATADVEFTLTYAEATKAPHSLCTITADEGLTLTALTLGAVDYVKVGDTVVDDELVADAAKITIDDNGKNIAAGKVLFESAVDSNAPTVKSIKFVATFAVADPDAIAEYNVTAAIDATNYDEADVAIEVKAGNVKVVEPPHVCDGTILENNGDGTHAVKCECGKVVTAAVACTYVDGFCACGAEEPVTGPIVDDTLVFASASVGFGDSSLQVNFRIRNNLLTKYSNMELVIIPQKYDLTTLNLVENPAEIVVPYAKLSGTGTFRTYAYTDIQLYELGLTIQYMLRGTDANGNAVQSPVYSTSAASYLKGVVPSDDYMATLIADTLIMGQSAMENTAASYPDSQLATDAEATITAGYDLSAATKDFDMESCNKVDTHNAVDSNWGVGSTGTHRMSKSVSIGKVPYISYRIRGGNSIDLDKLKIRVTYTTITGSEYDYTFTSADTANLYKSGTFVMFNFDAIGLGDSDKDINIVATYDGAEVFNAVYSVETYFYNNMSTLNSNLQVLATNILKLGSSFRANMNK